MTRWEYTEQVLANLRRVTRAEREAIRAEIDGHMEDHVCDLLELGYPPELAEEAQCGACPMAGRYWKSNRRTPT